MDLNGIVDETRKMLQRLLGEDVELVTDLACDLDPVKVDRGHMEQVIMNLAVNARDAMPEGGRLVIETRNLDAEEAARSVPGTMPRGAYVLLSVTDTGAGMDEETLGHIFEPFFTTKDKGKGTGLGLSTVYGIVQQSGGCIVPESAPGRGARFRIYLPRAIEALPGGEDAGHSAPLPEGRETILIVEDEPWVRGLARRCLEKTGYRVLEAANGEEALRLLAKADRVDLLVTDVVMPRLNGPQLVERLRDMHPELLVIFVSGYPDHAAGAEGRLDPATAFIAKPFTLKALAGKVREMLDSQEPAAAAP
jgi:CheY-like chemotaxis protein